MMTFPAARHHAENDLISDEEHREFQTWIDDWVHFAVTQNHIKPSCPIDNEMIQHIRSCYRMNMSAEEAVFVCFRIQKESRLF